MGQRKSATTLSSELAPEELSALVTLVRGSNLRGRHLEIGTAAGGTLCRLMSCFEAGRQPQFVVVDPMTYFPDQLETVKGNLRRHGLDPATVDFRVSKSADAFEHAAASGERYDFMLIDGAHKIRYVTQDLRWTWLLNAGGLVCCHDYTPAHKGVTWPVDRLLRKHANYRRECLVGSLLVIRKTAPSRTPEIGPGDRLWATLLSPWLQVERNFRKRIWWRRGASAKARAAEDPEGS